MHAGDKPMRHVNIPRSIIYDSARRLLTARPWVVLSLGLVLYIVLALVSALLFLAAGPSCYLGINGTYGFLPMLYLSLHVKA